MHGRLASARIALGALLIFLAALAAPAKFTTQTWHTKIEISKDHTLTITETIGVTFTEQQRGLIRTIPVSSSDGRNTRSHRFELVKGEVDTGAGFRATGAAPSFKGSDWVVRLGRADEFLTGKATFRLVYRVYGAITPFESHPTLGAHAELNWNAVPTGWSTAIEKASIEAQSPEPPKGRFVARILSGKAGTRKGLELSTDSPPIGDTEMFDAKIEPGRVTATRMTPLPLNEGITVIISLPDGTLGEPAAAPAIEPVLPGKIGATYEAPIESKPNVAGWIAALTLPFAGIPFLYYIRARSRTSPGPLVVRFEPPEGVTAADAGVVMDGKADQRDIVAGIIQLAAKGAVTIDHAGKEDKGLRIEIPETKAPKGLTPFEKSLLNHLSTYGNSVTADDLEGTFGDKYDQLTRMLEQNAYSKGWFKRGSWTDSAGCIFPIVTVAIGTGVFFINGCFAIVSTVSSIAFGFYLMGGVTTRTKKGEAVHQHLLGLREFITRAQEKELDYMSRVQPTQALFEQMLPFAVAFGAVEQWSRAFDGIQLRPPQWYHGYDSHDGIWTAMLAQDLLTAEADYGSAMTYSPPSTSSSSSSYSSGDSGFGGSYSSDSGFSGGGDVGGGGGGGGGDSW